MNSTKLAGLILIVAFAEAAWASTQCDTFSPGNYADTRFDSGADCSDTGGVDDNGGWNQAGNPFIEAGPRGPGDFFRVTGVVGTYDVHCTGEGDTARDLDWIRFSVAEPCYIAVSLSMRDRFGNALNGTDAYDLLFIELGSDSETAVDLYGEYGTDGCPHVAKYTFANGSQQARFPVPAGDVLVIVTTPFAPPSTPSLYHGPMPYGLNVSVTAYDHPACLSATNGCLTTSLSGGCSDGECCDLVCGLSPHCCDAAWDQNCVQSGLDQCGLCDYGCCHNGVAPNDCIENAELVTSLPAFISFDCSGANSDGPNDPSHLCASNTVHDLWWIVGPTPSAGELLVSMCGLGNTGDAVVSLFDLGTSGDIGNLQDLASKYLACRDDTCDDDGDGNVDLGGPAGINLIGVPANEFLLVRVGAFQGSEKTSNPGFPGTMEISFRTVFVDHGLQSVVSNNGVNTNLGLISGWVSAANPKRWVMVPFEMTVSGLIDGFDFAAFDSTAPDQVDYKIIARNPAASYGNFGRPFDDGNYVAGQVIASGTEPLDMTAFADVGDDFHQRYFIDLSSPFQLEPGSYYFSIYGSNSNGSTGAAFAWLLYGRKGMPQITTASVTIPVGDGAGASSEGTFAAGTPFGWRSIGAGPKFCFYNLGPLYKTQLADNSGLLYNCAFNLKGQLATPCFGDLDESGEVDGGDLGLVLLDFGPCPGCPSDLDGSGEVDGGDIGLVLLSFGPCQ